MKRAFAREWLWLLGCAIVAASAVAGMRMVGRFVISATPEHYAVDLSVQKILTVDGRQYVDAPGMKPIPLDELRIEAQPASTDWEAMRFLVLLIGAAVYGTTAFARITLWAVRLTSGRDNQQGTEQAKT